MDIVERFVKRENSKSKELNNKETIFCAFIVISLKESIKNQDKIFVLIASTKDIKFVTYAKMIFYHLMKMQFNVTNVLQVITKSVQLEIAMKS